MTLLVVQLPARARLQGGDAPALPADTAEYPYVVSPDGLAIGRQGQASARQLPRADTVVAVLADSDVAWHRVTLPKAPAGRLRAALGGLLEEALLAEAEDTHLALAPDAAVGAPTWVAAVDRGWLRRELAVLERAGRVVERVLPLSWPDAPARGHFDEAAAGAGGADETALQLTWAHADGVASLPASGTLVRELLPPADDEQVQWTAAPAVAAAAERWLGRPVLVLPPEQRLLQAARSLWNLRQFDLALRHRGWRALRDLLLRLRSPAWRPVRWAVGALVALQLVGLNAYALQQRQRVEQRKEAMTALLRSTHPQVRAVLDAPLQMQRETDQLRAAAGEPGADDFETLLRATAAAWPAERPPADTLRYEGGRLSFAGTGWSEEQVQRLRVALQPNWRLDNEAGRLSVGPARPGASL